MSIPGCDKIKQEVKASARNVATEEIQPVKESIGELEKKVADANRELKKQFDEIEARRKQAQQQMEETQQKLNRRMVDETAKQQNAKEANDETLRTVSIWVKTCLLLLGIITVIRILAKPLWRVVQTIILKRFAPAPRRIFEPSAK